MCVCVSRSTAHGGTWGFVKVGLPAEITYYQHTVPFTVVPQVVQRLPDIFLCIRTLAAGANNYCCSLQVPLVHVQLHRGKEL